MIRTLPVVFVLVCGGAFGQAPAKRLEFDVVDIKLNKSGNTQESGGVLPGGQFAVRNVTLGGLLTFAYDVRDNYFIGTPSWINSDRFDIVGKAPPNTPDDTLRLMLQSLLADEFKLAIHKEQRPMDVFALVVGKGGSKLQKSAESGKRDCKRTVTPQIEAELICKNMTMADLAETLPQVAPAYVDRAVVDQTGIEGTYDFKLNWVGRANIDQGGLTMMDAVDKMLGLKLEAKKLPMTVIVIDHVERLADN